MDRSTTALIVIIAMGGVLRFYTIGAKTMWLDEAFSVWIAHHEPPQIITWLIKIDQHPPLYYMLLHFWQRLFGDMQGVVRAFSALCGTMAIPFTYLAARRLCDHNTGLIAALILAVSPFHVRFGQETRMYALLTLAVALALYFLARILMDDRDTQVDRGRLQSVRRSMRSYRIRRADWPWFGLGLAQGAIMLIHNTATVYFPIALNLAMLGAVLMSRWRAQPSSWPALNKTGFTQRWLTVQGLAFLLWLPWSYAYVIQALGVDREFWLREPSVGTVWETFHNFNLVFLPGWMPLLPVWDSLYLLLALLGLFWLRRLPARGGLLLALWLVPPIVALLVSLRRPIFYDRTLIWTTLPYYILMAAGINGLGRTALSPLADRQPLRVNSNFVVLQALILVLIVTLSSASIYTYYTYFEKEDWAKAAAYVAERIEPDDIIIFNATWVQIPFEYYLRHYDVEAQLNGLPVDLFDRGVLEPKMTVDDLPYMRELIAEQPRIWLVYSHDWYTDPQQIIPRELGRQMREMDRQGFVGLQVMRFEQ